MAQVVETLEVVTPEGEEKILTVDEAQYGYRKSAVLAQRLIVTGVHFRLEPGDRAEIAENMRTLAAKRREKQPITLPSAGSFFKRPEGYFAGGAD